MCKCQKKEVRQAVMSSYFFSFILWYVNLPILTSSNRLRFSSLFNVYINVLLETLHSCIISLFDEEEYNEKHGIIPKTIIKEIAIPGKIINIVAK